MIPGPTSIPLVPSFFPLPGEPQDRGVAEGQEECPGRDRGKGRKTKNKDGGSESRGNEPIICVPSQVHNQPWLRHLPRDRYFPAARPLSPAPGEQGKCPKHRSTSSQPSLTAHQAPETGLLLWMAFVSDGLPETEKATVSRLSYLRSLVGVKRRVIRAW